jgi:predicted permease
MGASPTPMLTPIRRLWHIVRRRRFEAELAEEIETHRWMEQRRLERAGLPADEARSRSLRTLGNQTLAREDARAVWIWPWLETVRQDARYALRALAREPGFAFLAVATLGCAVGLNTGLFSVFNAIALRPWLVKEPARLLTVVPGVPLGEYEYIRAHARSLSGVATSRCIDGVLDGCGLTLDDRTVTANVVSSNYFHVLGVDMARGAGFDDARDRLDVPSPVAILSFETWQARFAQDPGTVGRVVRLDDVPFTIVGIAEPRFHGTSVERVGIWIPLSALPLLRPHYLFDPARLGTRSVDVRLAPDKSIEEASAEVNLLHVQYGQSITGRSIRGSGLLVRRTSVLPTWRERTVYQALALLSVAVGLVLLLACANVGNLLLARASARRVEIGVRLSIGASRSRLVRQLMTESAVIAAAASVVGLGLAWILPRILIEWIVGPVGFEVAPDIAVLGYTLTLAVVTCLAFGLAPALHGSRASLTATMSGRMSVPAIRSPLRGALMAVQVAVSMVLLVNAALMVRGVSALGSRDVGFDMDGVDVISFVLPASYSTPRVRAFAASVVQDTGSILGSTPFGLADVAPFGKTDRFWTTVRVRGADGVDRDATVLTFEVSSGYFDVLHLPLLAGRNFVDGDGDATAVIINERMAQWHWPDGTALGQTVVTDGQVRRVVGIVKTVASYYGSPSLTGPTLYERIGSRVVPQVLVRDTDVAAKEAMAAFAAGLEPRVRVDVAPLSQNRERLVANARVGPWLAAALGVLAVVLAAIGVFSVFAFTVVQRTPEIGIRLALGARPAQVIGAVVSTSSRALVVGTTGGVLGALAGSFLIRRFLYDLSPLDPLAYVSAGAILIVAGLAAAFVPAWRAARIDPLAALRTG